MVDIECINRAAAAHRAAVAHLLESHQKLVEPLIQAQTSTSIHYAASSLHHAYVGLVSIAAGRITDLERLRALYESEEPIFCSARENLTHRLARHIDWAIQLESGCNPPSPDGLICPEPMDSEIDLVALYQLLDIRHCETPSFDLNIRGNPLPPFDESPDLILSSLPDSLREPASNLFSVLDAENDAQHNRKVLASLIRALSLDPLGVCPLPGLHSDAILPLVLVW